jgi:hypothetical protein
VPLITRFGLDYYFDNSSNLIEESEKERLSRLSNPPEDPADEYRHMLTPIERFGLGINRVDMLTFALGLEAPLAAATDFYIHPIIEWQLGVPVNRQQFDCLRPYDANDPDSCLDIEGIGSFPQNLTLGVRVLPPVRGLGLLLAADIGLTGASDFVRELSPAKPYDVILALSLNYGERPCRTVVKEVVHEVEAVRESASVRGRIKGLVVEQGSGIPVPNAVISYLGHELTAQQVSAQGSFVSYSFEPGEVKFEVTHPEYEPNICTALIPAPPASTVPADTASADTGPEKTG